MKIALLADIHANLGALRACLRHAEERAVDRYAFLGDLVDYGAEPGPVIDVIAQYAAAGAIVVRGNHDTMPETILTPMQREFLQSLPLCVRDGDLCFVHSSARAPESWEYIQTAAAARETIDAAQTTYTFAGHVHDQVLYFKTLAGKTAPFRPISGSAVPLPSHRGWLAIVGSVGQSRDDDPAAAYAIFDDAAEEMTFYRVPYAL